MTENKKKNTNDKKNKGKGKKPFKKKEPNPNSPLSWIHKSKDNRIKVYVKVSGDICELTGTLKHYDQHMNLTLISAELKMPDDSKKSFPYIVLRGGTIFGVVPSNKAIT